jgi:hypothetical protein
MMHRKLPLRSRLSVALAAVLAGSGGALLAMTPASAATVERTRYVTEYATAYANRTSPDGCTVYYASVDVGMTSGGAASMNYATSTVNNCTGEREGGYGSAPTQVFDWSPDLVHAVATVPLSDGTQAYIDLTWEGTGVFQRGGSNSRVVSPGEFVQQTSTHGTQQQATVTGGTEPFDTASISASNGSFLLVTIDQP